MRRCLLVVTFGLVLTAAAAAVPMGVAGSASDAVPTNAVGSTGVVGSADVADSTDVAGTPSAESRNLPEPDLRNASANGGRIVELYPNPVAAGNRGEYLVLSLPGIGNRSLSDGHHEASVPSNATGEVALAMDPANASDHLDDYLDVYALDDYFPLAAAGDRIELRKDGEVVDVVEYGRVREGYRWRAEWDEWRPDGYDPRPPTDASDATVTPFVLPDSPDAPLEPIEGAESRLLVAGYTLESERVADALVDATERGIAVRVLIEGTPVGGFSERGAAVADRLDAAGVDVRVLDGEPDRFRFHHAKYAVADDHAIVLTENWKPSGTGGRSSRGWGVVTRDPRVADDLEALFENDADADDTREWAAFREEATFHGSREGNGTYPSRFGPPEPEAADVEVLTAPGNAGDRIVARIDGAEDRVFALAPRVGGPDERIVRALRRAAERGVDAHLLLSGAWYDRADNRELAASLADEPIDVAVAEPRGRFGKVHAKGIVIDDTVVVGSLNYNEVARTENREVVVAIESAAIADFYARAYAADWRGGGVHLPVGLIGGLTLALGAAGAVARREVAFV